MTLNVVINGVTYVPAPEQPAEATMTQEEARILFRQIDKSSMTYALVDYSTYTFGSTHIRDARFHQLRNAFVEAHRAMFDYLNDNGAIPR